MTEKAKDIYVEEVMSRTPRIGTPDMTVRQAAMLMKSEDVGSLIIIDKDEAVGMLTERDLLEKIVSEGRSASRTKVGSVMTHPLVTVGPKETITNAARMMATLKLRRLPVVSRGKLIGLLTENDVLKLSPSLIELTREWSMLGVQGKKRSGSPSTSGYCENCGAFSSELIPNDSELLCAECAEQLGSSGNRDNEK
jgi:signal-transduction protein with cAMP-binding, CBS, and nucleotidyltransferase domain